MNHNVAVEILSQLGGHSRLSAMIGASSFAAGQNSLSFRIKAKAKNKAKALIVTLTGQDLYDVDFLAMKGFDAVTVDKLVSVSCEQLKPMIEAKLGLSLSL